MKITDYIANSIDRLPRGYVFTYADFMGEVKSKDAVIKALNRMVTAGRINKLSKGKYFKPEKTTFGELAPPQYQIVKDLLEEDGKVIGYLTGYSIYSKLGLSTQIGNLIQIGKNEVRPEFKRGRYKISFVRQRNTITKESIPLLQILDAIRYVRKIPDATISKSCLRFIELISRLSESELKTLVRLSQKYPPSCRALLGAILEHLGLTEFLSALIKSLNPITQYQLPGVGDVLSNAQNWNIV
jgi:hypothetical protein